MAGFREQFITGVKLLSKVLSTKRLIQFSDQQLILPFYHAISDRSLPHIQHLYGVKNRKTFEQDLDTLLHSFLPLSLAEFYEVVQGTRKLSQPSFLLSFDDGLREFHDVIAPILLKKGIPAVCFLNAAFVDNKDLFFRYKSSLLIDQFEKNRELLHECSLSRLSFEQLKTKILTVKYKDQQLLDKWAKEIGYSFEDYLNEQQPYLTTTEIRDLKEQGFDFGGHSIDHPEYQFLTLEEQLRQTKESVDYVKKMFNINQTTFSFPFTDYGVHVKFFETVQKEKITDITFACAGQKIETAAKHFQRIPMEMGTLSAKQIINGELLYFLLKQPFGKNRITRK